jgi:hypothetical protein
MVSRVSATSLFLTLLLSKYAYVSRVPWEGTQMKKRKKPKRLTKPRNKRAAAKKKATPAVKQPKPAIKIATGSSGQSRTTYSGRQVHQGCLQPDRREGMPPLRSDDVEGARCVHGETRERSRPGTLRKAYGVRYGVKPLFTLGQVVATPGALAALEKAGQQPGDFLARHVSGDWGEVPPKTLRKTSSV